MYASFIEINSIFMNIIHICPLSKRCIFSYQFAVTCETINYFNMEIIVDDRIITQDEFMYFYGAKAVSYGLIDKEKFNEVQRFLRNGFLSYLKWNYEKDTGTNMHFNNKNCNSSLKKMKICRSNQDIKIIGFNVSHWIHKNSREEVDPIFLMTEEIFNSLKNNYGYKLDMKSPCNLFCENISPIDVLKYLIIISTSKEIFQMIYQNDKKGSKMKRKYIDEYGTKHEKIYDHPTGNVTILFVK